MRFRTLLPVVALSTLGTLALHADTFNFSFGESGDAISGTGVLTGVLSGAGTYTITAVQGVTSYPGHSGLNIAGILTSGVFQGNNNLLTLNGSGYEFDGSGLSYRLSDATDINLYTDETRGAAELFQTRSNVIGSEYVPYAITAAAPEPSSFILTGMGILSAYGVLRRRF